MIIDNEIVWMAGFFDGEGNITINRMFSRAVNPVYNLLLTLVNTDKRTIPPFRERFGGSIRIRKSNFKDVHIWNITGKAAGNFLNQIYPYSMIKKEEIDIANKFLALPKKGRGFSYGLKQREQLLQELNSHHGGGFGRRGRPPTDRLLKFKEKLESKSDF